MPESSLVRIGIISAAHGIRGEVKLRSFATPPEAIFTYGTLTDEKGTRTFALTQKGVAKDSFIASIFGVTDRNQSELLKGIELYAPSNAVPKSLADKVMGLEARLADGTVYGRIIGVYNFGAGDIIEIRLQDGKEEMLPCCEPFIGEINTSRDYVVIVPADYIEENTD